MGGSKSKRKETPGFDKPWRNTPWDKKEYLEKNLREFRLSHPNIKYVRILLTGEVGAGKSSFINSVNSAFQKRITTDALADCISGTSFTKTYRTYYIRNGDSNLPFVFNDIMGIESEKSHGAQSEDIVKALTGHLPEGYNFNPTSSVGDEVCKSNPTPQEQTNCLVYIIAADKLSLMGQSVIEKMKAIRAKASELEIPQAIIMTRVDEACPLVKADLRNIYKSKKIKEKCIYRIDMSSMIIKMVSGSWKIYEQGDIYLSIEKNPKTSCHKLNILFKWQGRFIQVEECCNYLGVPMSYIFPVKNYHEEIDTVDNIDVLILRALTDLVNIANDGLRNKNKENAKSE